MEYDSAGRIRQLPGANNLARPGEVHPAEPVPGVLMTRRRRSSSGGAGETSAMAASGLQTPGGASPSSSSATAGTRRASSRRHENGPERNRVDLTAPIPVYLLHNDRSVVTLTGGYTYEDIYGYDAGWRGAANRYSGTGFMIGMPGVWPGDAGELVLRRANGALRVSAGGLAAGPRSEVADLAVGVERAPRRRDRFALPLTVIDYCRRRLRSGSG